MKKLVIFGEGDIAQIARDYFEQDTNYKVVAFTLDKAFIKKDVFESKPMLSFENIERKCPPSEHDLFIALSYTEMNQLRQEKYLQAKSKGYKLASYVSPRCNYLSNFSPGDNCFIFEGNTIQPYVRIGSNVTIWSGNHIGHHSEIESHNFISSHVVISGHCTIESNCFLGVNATIAHNVIISKGSLIGAGAIIAKNTESFGVYVGPRSIKLDKRSDQVKL